MIHSSQSSSLGVWVEEVRGANEKRKTVGERDSAGQRIEYRNEGYSMKNWPASKNDRDGKPGNRIVIDNKTRSGDIYYTSEGRSGLVWKGSLKTSLKGQHRKDGNRSFREPVRGKNL